MFEQLLSLLSRTRGHDWTRSNKPKDAETAGGEWNSVTRLTPCELVSGPPRSGVADDCAASSSSLLTSLNSARGGRCDSSATGDVRFMSPSVSSRMIVTCDVIESRDGSPTLLGTSTSHLLGSYSSNCKSAAATFNQWPSIPGCE